MDENVGGRSDKPFSDKTANRRSEGDRPREFKLSSKKICILSESMNKKRAATKKRRSLVIIEEINKVTTLR